jgi:hypothetical protein
MSGRVVIIGAFFMALAGAILGILLFGNNNPSGTETVQVVTIEVVITATPDPNATIPVIIITATPDRTQLAIPTNLAQAVDGVTVIAPTIDATQLAANPALAETQLSLPQNCIPHTVASGDTPFGIAVQYDADPFLLLEANGLTEESSTGLQIGDVLIVPLAGCPLEELPAYQPASQIVSEATTSSEDLLTPSEGTEEVEVSGTAVASTGGTPVAGATITLAPTATDAQVEISSVERPGDVTAEGIVVRNTGNTVNMTGWTLSDSNGNVYTFREYILFSNAFVTIYTRVGQNTPAALYWGQTNAIWGDSGDVATLSDAQGRVQATIRLSTLIDLGS